MARAKRNDVYTALWNLLLTVPAPTGMTWATRENRLKHWDQVPPGSQPAMFMQQVIERSAGRRQRQVPTWEWHALAIVYFRSNTILDQDDWRITNEFLDNFDRIIQGIPVGECQTLGGIVYDCYVEGDVGLYEGQGDPNQAVIVIPLTVLTGL
jgi:hypothetical protein